MEFGRKKIIFGITDEIDIYVDFYKEKAEEKNHARPFRFY